MKASKTKSFKTAAINDAATMDEYSHFHSREERLLAGKVFLGWTKGTHGFHCFGRQLRDMKFSFPIEGATPKRLKRYAELCGWTLARAHANSGDAAKISGYLGKSDVFDLAIGKFALAYADQTKRDHAALVAAVKAGRIEALQEENL